MDEFKTVVLQKYADFSGRAGRREYWMFTLIVICIYLVLGLLAGLFGDNILGMLFTTVYVLTALALFVPSLAVTIRRLHDTDRSGWWFLISFVPIVGPFILLYFLILAGTPDSNRFGPAPAPTQGQLPPL